MKPVEFYLKHHINPEDYGFVKKDGYWILRFDNQRSAVDIDFRTRRIHCNGVSSALLAVLFHIAEDGGIDIDDGSEPRKFRMNLTAEEVAMVTEMRERPKE